MIKKKYLNVKWQAIIEWYSYLKVLKIERINEMRWEIFVELCSVPFSFLAFRLAFDFGSYDSVGAGETQAL